MPWVVRSRQSHAGHTVSSYPQEQARTLCMRYYRGTFSVRTGQNGSLNGFGQLLFRRFECCMHYQHIMARLYLCGYKFMRLPLDSHKLNSRRGISITIIICFEGLPYGLVTGALGLHYKSNTSCHSYFTGVQQKAVLQIHHLPNYLSIG